MIADLRRHRHDVNMTFQFRQEERVFDGRIVLGFVGLPEPDGYMLAITARACHHLVERFKRNEV
jgi:hypothetical protein